MTLIRADGMTFDAESRAWLEDEVRLGAWLGGDWQGDREAKSDGESVAGTRTPVVWFAVSNGGSGIAEFGQLDASDSRYYAKFIVEQHGGRVGGGVIQVAAGDRARS